VKIPPFWLNAVADIKNQLSLLVFPGFVAEIPLHNLEDYPRYLKAVKSRLEKLNHSLERDKQSMLQVDLVWQKYQRSVEKDKKHMRYEKQLDEIRWMIEELRISLFAQETKTKMPISVQRIEKIFSKMAL
jgi:ATP-dependent helicase HrpA